MQWMRKSDRPQPRVITNISLQTDFVVVNPPVSADGDTDTNVEASRGTILTGELLVTSEPYLNVRTIEIRFESNYRYHSSELKKWVSGTIFNLHRSFSAEDVTSSISDDGTSLRHKLPFAITIPSSTPTFEETSTASMRHQVVSVVELGFNSSSRGFLKQMRRTSSVEHIEGLKEDAMVTESFAGGMVYMPMRDIKRETNFHSSGISNDTVVDRITQTLTKNIVIGAHPDPTFGTYKLRVKKNSGVGGIGIWNCFLWSDSFSVGSYLLAKFTLSYLPTDCTIFAIRLTLTQNGLVVPIDQFIADNLTESGTELKPHNVEIYAKGQVPKAGRPGVDVPALWRGSRVEHSPSEVEDDTEASTFRLETGKIRMPDEKLIRPSTAEGTITPIRIRHSIALRLFFSIKGRTIKNEMIEGDDQNGDLRMLVVNMPVRVPSCICIVERVRLPEYAPLSPTMDQDTRPPVCACCRKTDEFTTPPFPDEFDEDRIILSEQVRSAKPELPPYIRGNSS